MNPCKRRPFAFSCLIIMLTLLLASCESSESSFYINPDEDTDRNPPTDRDSFDGGESEEADGEDAAEDNETELEEDAPLPPVGYYLACEEAKAQVQAWEAQRPGSLTVYEAGTSSISAGRTFSGSVWMRDDAKVTTGASADPIEIRGHLILSGNAVFTAEGAEFEWKEKANQEQKEPHGFTVVLLDDATAEFDTVRIHNYAPNILACGNSGLRLKNVEFDGGQARIDAAEAAVIEAKEFPYGEIETWIANKATMVLQDSPQADLRPGQVIGSGWEVELSPPAIGSVEDFRVKTATHGVAYSLTIQDCHVIAWPVEIRKEAILAIRNSRHERDGVPQFDLESGANGLELILPLTGQHILENLDDHTCPDRFESTLEDREILIESSCLRHWRVRASGGAQVALRQCSLGGLETDNTAEVTVDYSTFTGEAPLVARGQSTVSLRKTVFHGPPATYDNAKMVFSDSTSQLTEDELNDGSHDESLLAFNSVEGRVPMEAFDKSLNAHLKLESLKGEDWTLKLRGTAKGYRGPYNMGNTGFFTATLVSAADGSVIHAAGTSGATIEGREIASFDVIYAGDYRALIEMSVNVGTAIQETMISSLVTSWSPPETGK